MSSLWTPDGERPVAARPDPFAEVDDEGGLGVGVGAPPMDEDEQREAAAAQYLAELQNTPAGPIVGNHTIQLFELARIYLTAAPPKLDDAQLVIDAMAALVEGLGGRLGEDEDVLKDGLAQIRMAFVQIKGAMDASAPSAPHLEV